MAVHRLARWLGNAFEVLKAREATTIGARPDNDGDAIFRRIQLYLTESMFEHRWSWEYLRATLAEAVERADQVQWSTQTHRDDARASLDEALRLSLQLADATRQVQELRDRLEASQIKARAALKHFAKLERDLLAALNTDDAERRRRLRTLKDVREARDAAVALANNWRDELRRTQEKFARIMQQAAQSVGEYCRRITELELSDASQGHARETKLRQLLSMISSMAIAAASGTPAKDETTEAVTKLARSAPDRPNDASRTPVPLPVWLAHVPILGMPYCLPHTAPWSGSTGPPAQRAAAGGAGDGDGNDGGGDDDGVDGRAGCAGDDGDEEQQGKEPEGDDDGPYYHFGSYNSDAVGDSASDDDAGDDGADAGSASGAGAGGSQAGSGPGHDSNQRPIDVDDKLDTATTADAILASSPHTGPRRGSRRQSPDRSVAKRLFGEELDAAWLQAAYSLPGSGLSVVPAPATLPVLRPAAPASAPTSAPAPAPGQAGAASFGSPSATASSPVAGEVDVTASLSPATVMPPTGHSLDVMGRRSNLRFAKESRSQRSK